MIMGEDEPSSGLNGRLRPRKSNPQTNKILRKSDDKNLQDKPKRNSSLPKVSPNKTDLNINKADNTTIQLLCPYCDKKFVSKQTASKHAHRIHLSSLKQDSFINCLFCNHVETEPNSIIRHMVDSHPNQYFACLDCHTRLPSTSDLADHKLNVCEKQKLPYRSKLRQKSADGKKKIKLPNSDPKESFSSENKEYREQHDFNGIVISCELKPTHVHDEADIEDNITTNLILPSGKGISHKTVIEKNAVIVLDDIQWNKRIPSNFSFHNTDADQILSRLGVVHKSPKSGDSKKDCHKNIEDVPQKFEKCFDTNFYSKVASNVHENLSKYLDGSFNPNPDPDTTIKTRKSKNCIAINTAEGFPILLACEQYSRSAIDGYMPRAIAPKHKWKWDSPENDKGVVSSDQIKHDSHLNNCIITYVSNLDIWTQLSMRRKFEEKFNRPIEKRAEKQNIISKELKEILESREIPTTSPQKSSSNVNHANTYISDDGVGFPFMLGLTPTTQSQDLKPAVLSGEWVRPRCYVCCACGAQTRDPRALSSHISNQHPNAYVQHYEIVGESLLDADILKHLYVPPSQTLNRSRPLRGFRECTKCKKSITLEDLHQHMLDCAGDTPTIRRKCRYRPFGVRKRRPRLPDNRIRKKMRKDMRTGQSNDKNHLRPRPKTKSEVGDAETIRKMLADLPAKRHRVMVNPLNSFPHKKHNRKCNSFMMKKRSFDDQHYINTTEESSTTEGSDTFSNFKANDCDFNNEDEEDDDDDLPLKPKIKTAAIRSPRQKESLNRKATMNRSKRKSKKEISLPIENCNEAPIDHSDSNQPIELSIDNTPNRVSINGGPNNVREHSNRGGSNNNNNNNNGDNQRPGSSSRNGNSNDPVAPTQNVPLKHSIASLTADSETQDKSVQFHRLFLVQQECNNLEQRHLPSDRRLLFENEAVVTKLDKPPLHFNPTGASDFQQQRKHKLNKPRKRLNDCIAMLKNKLTPSNENNIPGHVSVQCGSDEPIEQEPFMIEEDLKVIEPRKESVMSPTLPPQTSLQELPFEETSTEHTNSIQLDRTSPKNNSKCEDRLLLHSKDYKDEFEINQNDKANMLSPKPVPTKCDSSILSNVSTPEIENSQADITPLPLPRNTVIRKSPKMSVNYTNPQEVERIVKSTHQFMEEMNNDCANQNLNSIKSNEVPPMPSDVISESNDKSQTLLKNMNEDLIDSSQFSPTNKYHITLTTELNIEQSPKSSAKELQIEQITDITPKDDVDYASNDFRDTPCTIPAAHASTNVESIISTPLDLSGKKSHTVNTTEDITFMNNYDSYETLDLSNKSLSADLSPNANPLNDIAPDVVVDLSIKSNFKSTNLKRSVAVLDNDMVGDLSYGTIDDNLPTDLSLKKNDITSSNNLISQNCGNVEFVQDLSSHKTKQREIIQERSLNIEYNVKELPTDLSSNGINDSSLIIEIIDNETDDSSDQDANKGSPVDILRELPQNHTYNTLGINSTREIVNPDENMGNDNINLGVHDKMVNYSTDLRDNDQSVTPIPSNLSHLNISPCVTNRSEVNNTQDRSKSITTTISQKCEMVKKQPITSFIDNTVLVPQNILHYDIGNSIINVSNAEEFSLPAYSNNERTSPQVPVSKFEGAATVCTPTDTSITVTIADKPSSPTFVTTLPSIPPAPISSSAPNLTVSGTSVCKNINFIDLSSETENSKTENRSNTGEVDNEHYDLTKEEIIDCDLEQDTETAKKIAMLPKELVKIIGTMPMDHRKQLLDVLPQYVSPSASFVPGESTTNQRSNISKTKSPSPFSQQAVPIRHGFGEELHKDLAQCDKNSYYETRSHSCPNTCVASSSSTQDSFPQSVILKTPVASNDLHQPVSLPSNHEHTSIISSELNRTVSVLSHPSKLTSEKAQNMIIDLTDEENIQEIRCDEQIIKNNLLAVNEVSTHNKTLQILSESPPQKGYSEQTASLRAVRIKTPSERHKKAASDYRVETHCESDAVKSDDYTCALNSNLDVQNVDRSTENATKVCNENTIHVSTAEVFVSPVKEIDGTEGFVQQSNASINNLSKSSVILTPASLEKNVKVSLGKKYGKRINRDISSFSENSKQKIIDNETDVKFNETIDSNLVAETDKNNLIEIVLSTNNILFTSTHPKDNINNDEDSEDDVSLAVIVQQKQREQSQLSGDNKSLLTKSDVTICKKKKRDRSRKVSLKNAKNDDEIMMGNQTKADESVDASVVNTEIDLMLNESKTQYDVRCANLDTEENYSFVERPKRKAKNRRDTLKSVEIFGQSEKQDETLTLVTGNIAPKSDSACTMLQENSKKIATECFSRTSDTYIDPTSTSVKYGENAELQPYMEVDTVNRQSFEKTSIPEENINVENKNCCEDLGCEERNKNEHDVGSSTQLNVKPTNIYDSKIQEISLLDFKNSQRKQDNEQKGKQIKLSHTDFKCKKPHKGKKLNNKDSTDSHNSFVKIDERSITPLRRSRRGKSMFVDNIVAEPGLSNQNDVAIDKKTPLTKKQLIFSKLLLDEVNVTKPVISSVVAKNPIVIISNVDLSSHLSSPPQKDKNETQSSLTNCTKPIKSSKRKKSPQTKRKSKKLKSFNNINDNRVCKSVALNNNDQKSTSDCEEQSPIEQSSYGDFIENDVVTASTIEHEREIKSDVIETQNNNILNFEDDVGQKMINETNSKSTTIEKRKISCTLTNADGDCASTSKKTKHDCVVKSVSKNYEIENQSTNESSRNSRGRNNNGETRNKTCYNSHVAVRRTRSKSVVVKSSTPLYDPYDIELEDMIEEDEPYGRKIKSSDIALKKLSFLRDNDLIKNNNKRETSVGVNTEPINTDTTTAQTSKNIESTEDANDSDDSSKSDVPLKKYVEEREKKNLELNSSNINEGNIASTSGEHNTDNSDNKKEEELDKQSSSSQQENNQEQKSEQFMESFGFFSERKPRKSNIIATQKIAETFHEETDEVIDEAKEQSSTAESETQQEEESVSRDTSPSPSGKSGKRGRKKASCTKPLPCYCRICKKEFKRPDNYLRHQMTLLHISKLSEVELKIKTTPVLEEPNYLVAYKQQLDRLKFLTDKVAKRKKTSKPTSKITLPTLDEILATVNKTVRDQQLSRRNLSRDEALFLDCCELLKESHKPDMSTTENITITNDVNIISTTPISSDINNISTTSQAPVAGSSGTNNSEETSETGNDGDVDSITAKNILESEEVRNLENDLISGLKEAAANSMAQTANNNELQSTVPEIRSEQIEEEEANANLPVPEPRADHVDCSEEAVEESSTSKSKKNQEAKEKMYPDVVDSIDIFEDKFDKIKRKCRSQAAAAKQVKTVIEPSPSSQKGRKKSEKKRGRGKRSKTMYHYTIPTKGALKVYDGIKVSIPTSEINMSAVPYSVENTPKKRKRKNTKKRGVKTEIEFKNKSNPDCKAKSTQTQKVDVYEFMDNEDAELFEFRPSTLMERFKNINNRDMPSTSMHVPCADKTDFSSDSGSDGDDFVYDDYVCSDEETENSLMSCELGNGRLGSESKKSNSSLKRKDVVEKNAVMGKIFKHNAVRSEKKCSKIKDHPKPKANLDQLFDSLLEEEPGPSSASTKSPKKGEFITTRKHELSKKQESVTPRKYECLTPREDDEPSSSKNHEFSSLRKSESISPKKHGYFSSKKHETSSRKHEADILRKRDTGFSRKQEYESVRKHFPTPSRKYECLQLSEHETEPPHKDESVSPKKQESVSCRKHDATSKYNSGKVYPVSSANKKDSDISSKNYDRPTQQIFDKPSSSKKYNSLTCHDIFRTSSTKYDSTTYCPSIDEPSTSKMSYEGFHSSKNRESSNDYQTSPLKRQMILSKEYDYHDSFRKYSRDNSVSPDLEEDNDSVSDCGLDNVDEAATHHDTGVARQRARRKCTVGKQNVLAETWSSESDPDGGPARPNSAESIVSPVGRKKRAKKREGQLYSIRRARQMPIKRQDVQARVALYKRSRSRVSSGSGECSRASSSVGPNSIATTLTTSSSGSSIRRPSGSKPRPRSAAYCWSSEGDEEQEHLQQHGWIVGDSHKKLVTMLAHAKGRKRNHDDKRHNVE